MLFNGFRARIPRLSAHLLIAGMLSLAGASCSSDSTDTPNDGRTVAPSITPPHTNEPSPA